MNTIRRHWPEYLMEGALLAVFMILAASVVALVKHPASPVAHWVTDALGQRACIGVGIGLCAISLIYSPWGQQSGAHMNPAVTLTYWRLGKVSSKDAVFYLIAHFLGGTTGLWLLHRVPGFPLEHPSVNFILTQPGPLGPGVAFAAEFLISCGLMTLVLNVSSHPHWRSRTGFFAGGLVAFYITFEAPLSGMSMNPARSFASAANAGVWNHWIIYGIAPVLGMGLASELFRQREKGMRLLCAKMNHDNPYRCIFCGKPDNQNHARAHSGLGKSS